MKCMHKFQQFTQAHVSMNAFHVALIAVHMLVGCVARLDPRLNQYMWIWRSQFVMHVAILWIFLSTFGRLPNLIQISHPVCSIPETCTCFMVNRELLISAKPTTKVMLLVPQILPLSQQIIRPWSAISARYRSCGVRLHYCIIIFHIPRRSLR